MWEAGMGAAATHPETTAGVTIWSCTSSKQQQQQQHPFQNILRAATNNAPGTAVGAATAHGVPKLMLHW
jgi:hypothetical protein